MAVGQVCSASGTILALSSCQPLQRPSPQAVPLPLWRIGQIEALAILLQHSCRHLHGKLVLCLFETRGRQPSKPGGFLLDVR